MFMDEVVFAGLLIVGGCIAFCGGFVYFIKKDSEKTSKQQ